jgi:choline-sulfatase
MHFVGPDQLHGFRCRLTTDIYPEEFTWVANRAPWSLARDPAAFDPEKGRGSHARGYTGAGVHVGRWHHHLSYDEETHYRAGEYLRSVAAAHAQRPAESPPFFLCVSYHHPHDPFWPPTDLWELYEGAPIDIPHLPDDLEASYSPMDRWLNANHGVRRFPELRDPESLRRVRRAYYAMVTYVDRKVGELVQTLRTHGLWKNTVVIFTSDHGDMLCEKGMVQKRSFYEFSSRVPLIVRLPGGERAGTVCPRVASLVDLAPTLLDLAGVPAEARLPFDGLSLLGELGGRGALLPDGRTAYAEMHVEDVPAPCFMARQGRYKYVYLHGIAAQLFDLADDPGEWRNLAGDPAHRSVEEALRDELVARFQPDAIEVQVRESLRRRAVIKDAMARTSTRWDYAPAFDPNRDALEQYLPPR